MHYVHHHVRRVEDYVENKTADMLVNLDNLQHQQDIVRQSFQDRRIECHL